MKIIRITLLLITVITVSACSSLKKSSASAVSPAPGSTTTPVVTPASDSYLFVKPADGIYAPGNEELTAIQLKYKDVTLDQLTEGHMIYTKGSCVGCHGAANIYQYGEVQWKAIIDDMAFRANITDSQKDAVYKYVLAIKATQPK